MTSAKVFNLRHLTKHILLFCGLEERVLLRDVNKIANGEYNTITPNLQDVKTLLGNRIQSCGAHISEIMPQNISRSYLCYRLDLYGWDGNCLGYQDMFGEEASIVFTGNPDWSTTRLITLLDNKIEMHWKESDGYGYDPDNINTLSYKCNFISALNYLPILIKKGSSLIYGAGWKWSEKLIVQHK